MRESYGDAIAPVADEFDSAVIGAAMRERIDGAVDRFDQLNSRFCCDDAEDSAHGGNSNSRFEIGRTPSIQPQTIKAQTVKETSCRGSF